jgi:hypothetical protein
MLWEIYLSGDPSGGEGEGGVGGEGDGVVGSVGDAED